MPDEFSAAQRRFARIVIVVALLSLLLFLLWLYIAMDAQRYGITWLVSARLLLDGVGVLFLGLIATVIFFALLAAAFYVVVWLGEASGWYSIGEPIEPPTEPEKAKNDAALGVGDDGEIVMRSDFENEAGAAEWLLSKQIDPVS